MGKNLSSKYGQNFLLVQKNQQQIQQKLLPKEQFKKQQKEPVI